MSKGERTSPKRRGRPAGTGAGYSEMVRVMLTPEALARLAAWKERHGAHSLSEAGRRIIEKEVGK